MAHVGAVASAQQAARERGCIGAAARLSFVAFRIFTPGSSPVVIGRDQTSSEPAGNSSQPVRQTRLDRQERTSGRDQEARDAQLQAQTPLNPRHCKQRSLPSGRPQAAGMDYQQFA
jgi:hypothetical protein